MIKIVATKDVELEQNSEDLFNELQALGLVNIKAHLQERGLCDLTCVRWKPYGRVLYSLSKSSPLLFELDTRNDLAEFYHRIENIDYFYEHITTIIFGWKNLPDVLNELVGAPLNYESFKSFLFVENHLTPVGKILLKQSVEKVIPLISFENSKVSAFINRIQILYLELVSSLKYLCCNESMLYTLFENLANDQVVEDADVTRILNMLDDTTVDQIEHLRLSLTCFKGELWIQTVEQLLKETNGD